MAILLLNKKVIQNEDMTGNITSDSLDLSSVAGYAVHSIWTGSPTGNIIIQGSNNDSDFTNLTTIAAGGAAGSSITNVPHSHYRYIKVIYSFTSGTGALNVYVSGKDF